MGLNLAVLINMTSPREFISYACIHFPIGPVLH